VCRISFLAKTKVFSVDFLHKLAKFVIMGLVMGMDRFYLYFGKMMWVLLLTVGFVAVGVMYHGMRVVQWSQFALFVGGVVAFVIMGFILVLARLSIMRVGGH